MANSALASCPASSFIVRTRAPVSLVPKGFFPGKSPPKTDLADGLRPPSSHIFMLSSSFFATTASTPLLFLLHIFLQATVDILSATVFNAAKELGVNGVTNSGIINMFAVISLRRNVFNQIFCNCQNNSLQHVPAFPGIATTLTGIFAPSSALNANTCRRNAPSPSQSVCFPIKLRSHSPPTCATQPARFIFSLGILDYPLKITPDPHFARVPSQPTQFLFKPLFGLGFAPTSRSAKGPFRRHHRARPSIRAPPK